MTSCKVWPTLMQWCKYCVNYVWWEILYIWILALYAVSSVSAKYCTSWSLQMPARCITVPLCRVYLTKPMKLFWLVRLVKFCYVHLFFCAPDLSTDVIIIVQNLFGLSTVLILYSWLVYSTLFLWEMSTKRVFHTDLHRVSKKTVPTYFLLLVCQIWTDFNKNWKDCPRRNP